MLPKIHIHACSLVSQNSYRLVTATYGAEPGEALVTEVRPNGVEADDKDVDSEVKLDAVEEERFVEVALNDDFFVLERVGQFLELLEQADAVSLRADLRLRDVGGVRVSLLVGGEASRVLRIGQLERRRDEVETLRVQVHAEAHRLPEDVLVREQLYVRVAVAHLGGPRVEPLENFFVGQIRVHPAQRGGITCSDLLPFLSLIHI